MNDQEFLKTLGSRIAEVRKAKRMSQLDVCSKLNFEKTYLSAIENGRQNITLLTCKQIAEALDVDIRDFLAINKD